MRIERLFRVLVLGGAALGAGCGDQREPAQTTSPDGSGAPEGGTAGSGGTGSGGTGASAGIGGIGASAGSGGVPADAGGEAGSGASGGSAGTAGGDAGTGDAEPRDAGDAAVPMCSDPPNPSDPCGCQCCWAGPGCGNDEPCCHGFCVSGNHGLGCCKTP